MVVARKPALKDISCPFNFIDDLSSAKKDKFCNAGISL